MQSLSLSTDKPLDPARFMPWLQDLVAKEGQKILRSKGILAFHDDDERYVFQGVHMMLEGDHQRPWKDGEAAHLVGDGNDGGGMIAGIELGRHVVMQRSKPSRIVCSGNSRPMKTRRLSRGSPSFQALW